MGVQFLPMPLGEVSAEQGGLPISAESRFAFGAGLSLGYDIWSGLIIGVAPQVITGAKPRDEPQTAGNEYDLMARVAYRYTVPGVAAVYAEVLPGYSLYYPVRSNTSKGFVLAGGVGCEIDLVRPPVRKRRPRVPEGLANAVGHGELSDQLRARRAGYRSAVLSGRDPL